MATETEKDLKTLREWSELTDQYIAKSSEILGRISNANVEMQQSFLPPLRVLKFYGAKLSELLTRNQPQRASAGETMYTVPDNVVSINSGKKRAERWSKEADVTVGGVRLIELE